MSFMRFRGKSAARVVGVLAASLGGLYAAPLAHADDNQDVDNLLKEIKQDPDGLHEPPPAADPNPDAPDPGDGPESDGGPVTPVPDGSLPPAPAPPPPVAPAPPPPVAPAPPPPVAPAPPPPPAAAPVPQGAKPSSPPKPSRPTRSPSSARPPTARRLPSQSRGRGSTPPVHARRPAAPTSTRPPPPLGAPVRDVPARAPAASGKATYTIEKGESLWSIARSRLGSKASNAAIAREVDRLWRLNAGSVASGDPDMLIAGEKLRLK